MSAKFTPGPWDYFIGNSNGRGLIRIESDASSPVAGVHIASLTRGSISDANARLIAAAPDMYEALKRIAEGNLGPAAWQADYEKIREVARAALAKAVQK